MITLFSCVIAEEGPPEPKAFLDPEGEIPASRKPEAQMGTLGGGRRDKGRGCHTRGKDPGLSQKNESGSVQGRNWCDPSSQEEGWPGKHPRPGEGNERDFIFRVERL